MVAAPEVLLVADAGPEIGGGHLMRQLTLASALAARGAAPRLLAPESARPVLAAFAPRNLPVILAGDGDPEALVAAAAADKAGRLVFDHFRLDAEAHRRAARGRPCAAVDDLADRPMGVDLLADPGPDRAPGHYAGLTEGRLLLGPEFALVRPAFAARRAEALARRARGGPAARVLVSLGLTDVGGITARVVDRLLPRLGAAGLDVVLGSAAPSRARMERLAGREPRLRLWIDTPDMADLAAAADLAVGSSGSSNWERCVVGLPAVILVLAENQKPGAAALARRGAAEAIDAVAPDHEAALDRAFTGLLRDGDRRRRMGAAAAAVCDGGGGDRLAAAVLSLPG